MSEGPDTFDVGAVISALSGFRCQFGEEPTALMVRNRREFTIDFGLRLEIPTANGFIRFFGILLSENPDMRAHSWRWV